MKKRLTYILSNIDKAIAFEWIAKELDKEKIELSFILLNSKETILEKFLVENNIYVKRIYFNNKKDYPKVFLKLIRELKRIGPNIVHTHMRDANMIGISVSKILGIKKRIYTRHSATLNHNYYPKAVKWDKLVNTLATNIVAISKNVEAILIEKENVPATKIKLIHHGFDLAAFDDVQNTEVEKLRRKYLPNNRFPVIGVIARYLNLKGHKYQIIAFKKLLEEYPNAYFVFANANGTDKNEIQKLIKDSLPPRSYTQIEFEPNLFALYKLFDFYVHTPINKEIEAFGQTYVEALASGIPSIFTLSGVANEFIVDGENALVVDFKNSSQIYDSIIRLIENKELQSVLIKNGKESVKRFGLKLFIDKLEKLYE